MKSKSTTIIYDRQESWSKGEFWKLFDVDELQGEFNFEFYLYPSGNEKPTQHFTQSKEEIKKWIRNRNSTEYPHLCVIQKVEMTGPMRNIW